VGEVGDGVMRRTDERESRLIGSSTTGTSRGLQIRNRNTDVSIMTD
jgi:hypothetical protein